MDSKSYYALDRPLFNKRSVYPEGFAPEAYVISYAVKVSNTDKVLLNLGCAWGKYSDQLVSGYSKIYNIDENTSVLENFVNKTRTIPNIYCSLNNPRELSFYDGFFDVIMSQRGPLFDDDDNFKEAVRVLKPGGKLIATITGEKDLLELKQSFDRGTNFYEDYYIEDIETRLKRYNHDLGNPLEIKIFRHLDYKEYFKDYQSLVDLLKSFYIIPDFDSNNADDQEKLKEYIKTHFIDNEVLLNRHVIFLVAVKKDKNG